MNNAERVKELAQHAAYDDAPSLWIELHAAIDAMQSALDDAAAKLAARDAEIERLSKALAYQKKRTQQESKRVSLLEDFLKRQGLLVVEFCRPGCIETKTDSWWVLWPVYMVDKTKSPLGYGNSEAEAIDAALSEDVKGGE